MLLLLLPKRPRRWSPPAQWLQKERSPEAGRGTSRGAIGRRISTQPRPTLPDPRGTCRACYCCRHLLPLRVRYAPSKERQHPQSKGRRRRRGGRIGSCQRRTRLRRGVKLARRRPRREKRRPARQTGARAETKGEGLAAMGGGGPPRRARLRMRMEEPSLRRCCCRCPMQTKTKRTKKRTPLLLRRRFRERLHLSGCAPATPSRRDPAPRRGRRCRFHCKRWRAMGRAREAAMLQMLLQLLLWPQQVDPERPPRGGAARNALEGAATESDLAERQGGHPSVKTSPQLRRTTKRKRRMARGGSEERWESA